MEAHQRYLIKEALRKARYLKRIAEGKRVNLTNTEAWDVISGYITIRKFLENNKSTWATERRELK